MTHPIIGWEQKDPVPDGHSFNRYLRNKNGRLHLEDLDLYNLFQKDNDSQTWHQPLTSPLEIVYLPLIRQQIQTMNQLFDQAIQQTGYSGKFRFAYASKANAAEEVIRTTLAAGAHHEMSSTVDVDIAKIMVRRGLLKPEQMVICNGFKAPGTAYSANIIQLRGVHQNVIPVLENMDEIVPFLDTGYAFDIGIRLKSYGSNRTLEEMDTANSRFGLDLDAVWKAADYIATAPHLSLKMLHNMVGSQLTDIEEFIRRLKPGIETFARLRQRYPSLSIFNFGGGMPIAMTLDFSFDYAEFIRRLLQTIQEACRRYNVPDPDVMGEFGRFTTSEHGAHLFKIITVKDNGSNYPWYIIDGSIMSSFPDSWALGEHFIVLPLNHLDKPFQRVQLGGITCDSDDVYPPKPSHSPLYLPVETKDLHVGFFSIGAYQEMLGGVRGSKHCVLPEAHELLIDRLDAQSSYEFELINGQTPDEVLQNLGYGST